MKGRNNLAKAGINIKDIWRVFLRRKWVFIGFFLIVIIVGLLFTFLKTPLYTSTSKIEVSGVYYDDNLYKYFPVESEALGIYAPGMRASELEVGILNNTAIELRDDKFLGEIKDELSLSVSKDELYYNISTLIDNYSRTLKIEVISDVSEDSFKINDRLINKYVDEKTEKNLETFDDLMKKIDKSIEGIEEQVILNSLKEMKYNLENNKDLYVNRIEIVEKPVIPSEPFNTNYIRNIIIIFFISIVAGLIAVFIPNIFIPLKSSWN